MVVDEAFRDVIVASQSQCDGSSPVTENEGLVEGRHRSEERGHYPLEGTSFFMDEQISSHSKDMPPRGDGLT